MLRELASALKDILFLRESTQKNTDDIRQLQLEVKALSAVVQQFIYEVRGNKRDEAYERENMTLRLQNELLKFERRLPAL